MTKSQPDPLSVEYLEKVVEQIPAVGLVLAPLVKPVLGALQKEWSRNSSTALTAAERVSGLSRENLGEKFLTQVSPASRSSAPAPEGRGAGRSLKRSQRTTPSPVNTPEPSGLAIVKAALQGPASLGDDPTVRDAHRTRRARQIQLACSGRASAAHRAERAGRPGALIAMADLTRDGLCPPPPGRL